MILIYVPSDVQSLPERSGGGVGCKRDASSRPVANWVNHGYLVPVLVEIPIAGNKWDALNFSDAGID
jgi:hypothetical protein